MSGGILAVDFDGTLSAYSHGWQGAGNVPDGPTLGARGYVLRQIRKGIVPVVFSTRAASPEGKAAIEKWLSDYNFPALQVTHEKIGAFAYVDDRAVPFRGDWGEVEEQTDLLANQMGGWSGPNRREVEENVVRENIILRRRVLALEKELASLRATTSTPKA